MKSGLTWLLLLWGSITTISSAANPPLQATTAKPPAFVVIGDMPYTDAEYASLEQPDGAIAKAIRALDPPLLIHIGDFKKGRLKCSDELFQDHYRQIARLNPHRTVYTPGDNDWTDCDRFTLSGSHDEIERLHYLRHLFFHQDRYQLSSQIDHLIRQSDLIENALWTIDRIAFATLHIPGTNNGRKELPPGNEQVALDEADHRDHSNEKWLQLLFTKAEPAQAVVIAFHADIFEFDFSKPVCSSDNRTNCDGYRRIRDLLKRHVTLFRKPVLVIHGDTPAYCLHQPYHDIPNLWRLNAPGDYKYPDASEVTFDANNSDIPFTVTNLLDRKPVPAVCDASMLGLP